MSDRAHDLVLYGATGFTGGWAARELARVAPEGLRWAVAGRDTERVADRAAEHRVPAVVADAFDTAAIDRLAADARVVISCAGPFSRYGQALVEACLRHGTHYADLSGELNWIEGLAAAHHEAATAAGTVLLPAAGFDSVPSDLAVLDMRERHGATGDLWGFYDIRGGFNGGTLASALAMGESGVRQEMRLPKVFPVPVLDGYATPFLMAGVNERMIARSEELLVADGAAAHEGRYREHMIMPKRAQAHVVRGILRTLLASLGSGFGRRMLKLFGPKPGEGPSEKSIREGHARLTILAGDPASPTAQASWSWTGDPSNLITVRCLVQVGLALAAGEARRGGVLTAASAFGLPLLDRLAAVGAVDLPSS